MATQKQLTEDITKLGAVVSKIRTETTGLQEKVKDLEDAMANQQNADPELVAAVEALKSQVQAIDDLVPDTGNPPTDPEPEPA